MGSFEYWKKDKTGRLFFQVTAYVLHVDRVLSEWPERDQRKRAWFTPEVAATLTGNSQLKALIQQAANVRAMARTGLN